MAKGVFLIVIFSLNLFEIFSNQFEFGLISSSRSLIQDGYESNRDQFPWMALVEGNHRTSGALLSEKHVIAVASAVRDWSDDLQKWVPKREPGKVWVTLGLVKIGGDYSKNIQASKITLHPNSTVYHKERHATINFAIITLKRDLKFDKFVKRVLVWTLDIDVENLSDAPMYVVGYGNDEFGDKSDVRKYAKVTPLDNEDCDEAFPHTTEQTFMKRTKTFCIKGSEKGNPCHEDESLFMKLNGTWFFRGFTVFRKPFRDPEFCEISPILFEDVQPYAKWIENEISIN